MIGDRFENDIAPAKEAGFATWWLADVGDGDWFELGRNFTGSFQESEKAPWR